ncbi:MAG TPA: T9SS type A sorting domain-containing protein, partial [Phaeodactylibacter sp.]|nr:T9SS type A sorting domain-containing protein [Phaeodactylibacter sp.]
WYFNGDPIEAAQETEYCIDKSGDYTLEVVDLESGCSSTYSRSVVYNEDFPNCMPVSTEEVALLSSLQVYPTLLQDEVLWVKGQVRNSGLRLSLFNLQGQLIWQQQYAQTGRQLDVRIELPRLAAGGYVLQAQDGVEVAAFRLIKP